MAWVDPEDEEDPDEPDDDPLDEPDRFELPDEEPELVDPELPEVEVLAELECDDPGSAVASTPALAALAMPMPAVIAVIRRRPRLRRVLGGRAGMTEFPSEAWNRAG